MALILADRVRETSTTAGTGTFTLAGAVASYQSFSAIGNANTTYYTIVNQSANEWEVGIGTYTSSGTTLSRDTVLASSNAGSLVNFSAGTKDVWGDYPAGKAVTTDTLAYPPAIGGTTAAAGTFTPLTVYDATTATKAVGIEQWNYSGVSKSIATQEATSSGLFFSSDGTKMYIVGSSADTVFQYNLSSAWGVSTATFTTGDSLAIGGQDTAASDIYFKPDGTAFYLLGDTNNAVFQYSLSTPWVINTGSYATKSFSVAAQETSPQGLWFKPDGTAMFVVGTANDNINEYSLGTAWDVTTATFVQAFSVLSQDTTSGALVFNPTGTAFYITGTTNDNVYQYNLATAWNISTASYFGNIHVGLQENTPSGLFIDFTADNRAYVVGNSSDTVFNYNTATTSVDFTSIRYNFTGYANFYGNAYISGQAAIGSSLTVYGGITAASTLSVSSTFSAASTFTASTTTGTIGLGTSQTTGAWTAGGTAQTGTMTLGQSTGNQTTNIQAGATASGSTKAINIGTAGLSGSTTNIAIGSAVSGSLGTTTIQAPTVNIGQTATQLSVTNTASAVNYVQVTGNVTTSRPVISAQGSDANIGLNLASKGNRSITLLTNSVTAFDVLSPASGVNYFSVNGAVTGNAPSLVASGTDTNISMAFLSKGTGAIDLAAGSSGVNISNGGTVTAITRTAGGTTYTSKPSITVSAPTTAGGVQATASVATMNSNSATVQAGGTGYTVGDVLTVVGGTPTSSSTQFTVATVSGGVVTSVGTPTGTNYSVLPTNPVSTTGGTGTGCTLNLLWGVASGGITVDTAGSGYVEQPTVTFSGGGGSGAAAYATVGSGTTVRSLGSAMSFFTPGGEQVRITESAGTAANYVGLTGAVATGSPLISSAGSDTNINLVYVTKGTGEHRFATNNSGSTTQLRVAHTASAVNYVQVTGAATTATPAITAQGSDTNVSIYMSSKGTGAVRFFTNGAGSEQFRVLHTAGTIVNYASATGSATGAAPAFSVAGSDTNIDLALTPKGTGVIQFGTYTATILTPTGYITIKDSGGTTRRLLVG